MKDIDVLVIGRACVDNIALVDKFPFEDKKAPMKRILVEAGGQGSTSSCCITRLGGKAVYYGRIGDDEEGSFCLKRLRLLGRKLSQAFSCFLIFYLRGDMIFLLDY